MMKYGFVPALGTPLDQNGCLVKESYRKEITDMIDCGAVGLLCMGSMGIQAFIRFEECIKVAQTAVEAAQGRVPVYVGAMDNSIARAKERMASMEDLDLTAFVFTTPYYEIDTREQIMNYFVSLAASTKHGIVLYDLPGVTQQKITYDMVLEFHEKAPNFIGIKSADLAMLRHIRLNPKLKNLRVFYSGLDTFDVAYSWGIGNVLDGMLPCTPQNTKAMIEALQSGDQASAAASLDRILELRDFFLEHDLWPCFSEAMNLLSYDGFFAPDWAKPVDDDTRELIREEMIKIHEL